jgi:hypothetical protein
VEELVTTAVLGMNSINTWLLTPSANPPEDGACGSIATMTRVA